MIRAICFSLFLVSFNTMAATYYVNASRPDDSGNGLGWGTAKKTIQAAVNVSTGGDSIIVTNGIYSPITTANKAIKIQSVNGASLTIIDGANSQRCATLGSLDGETNSLLIGLTLRNGKVQTINAKGGGAIYGTINECIITNNQAIALEEIIPTGGGYTTAQAYAFGGGVFGSSLARCIIAGNLVYAASEKGNLNYEGANGGGAYNSNLQNCLVINNTAHAHGYTDNSGHPIARGGGLYGGDQKNCHVLKNILISTVREFEEVTLLNWTVQGHGVYGASLENCIVWGNTGENYNSSTLQNSCSTPLPTGAGNISSDPLFVNFTNNNFHLQSTSPCINAGANGSVQTTTDLDGTPRIMDGVVDMGAYEFSLAKVIASQFGLPEAAFAITGSANNSCMTFGGQTVQVSGALLGHNKSQGFTFSPTGAGRLTFRWNVSSEYYYDALSFYVDNVLTAQFSGKNVTWVSMTNTVLTVGQHTFKWEYAKDGDTSVGQDTAWIADVAWTPRSSLTVENGSGDGDYFIGDVIPVIADAAAAFFLFDRWTGNTNGVGNVFASTTQFTMPGAAALLTATYTPILFSLSVTNGTGDGSYTNGQTIAISADVISGKSFYLWTGDTGTVADVTASTTSVSIPGAAVSLTAAYRVPLTVNGGTGSGLYPEQTTVGIAAATPPEGMVFDRWTVDTATVANVSSATTTVTMPTTGISLTATYVYSLPLVVGDGSLVFQKTGIESSVIVAPGMGPSGGPAICFTNLLDSQSAGLETVVQGAGKIRFQWRVGSEAEADFLLFKVDGVLQSSYSGKNKPWVALTNSVAGAGSHVLRWEYVKDESGSVAPDAGWLDNIFWSPAMTGTLTPVPYVWLDQYPTLLALAGGSYDAAALADVDQDGHTAMQEYVTGSIPTNKASVLRAVIDIIDGNPRITWTPDMGTQRIYTVEGKTNLTDVVWHSPTNAGSKFFRVKTEMP